MRGIVSNPANFSNAKVRIERRDDRFEIKSKMNGPYSWLGSSLGLDEGII